MDTIIHYAMSGAYEGYPKRYTQLYKDLVEANMTSGIYRFQDALFRGKLVDELFAYLSEVEASRP